MIKLQSLQKGDLVRILCTARSAQIENLQPAASFLRKMELRVDYGATIGKVYHQSGGTAQERLADFLNAWNDPVVAAIWIARGGYGTIQILDGIDFASTYLDTNRQFQFIKPVIGYSDVTLIHSKMQRAGLPSIHTFMPLEILSRSAFAKASLKQALFGEKITIEIANSGNLKSDHIAGTLYGGNLSILYSMLGSDDLPDFRNGILFIEEIDEYLYHLERMMFSLKRAGKLDGLKSLLVGGMTDMNDHDIPFGKTAFEIIKEQTTGYDYPVVFNVPAGHVKNNCTLKMGMEMQIEITADAITLTQE